MTHHIRNRLINTENLDITTEGYKYQAIENPSISENEVPQDHNPAE
jgi:hypothetical protein